MRLAVVKETPAPVFYTVNPGVSPAVIMSTPHMHVMEYYDPPSPETAMVQAEGALSFLWSLSSSQYSPHWRILFKERFGYDVPEWALMDRHSDLIHGDPTYSNILKYDEFSVVIADPVEYREYIPPNKYVDIGKMLQSYLGWEAVAYGWSDNLNEHALPGFFSDLDSLRAATFWCGVACHRIQKRNTDPFLIRWATRMRKGCFHAVGF